MMLGRHLFTNASRRTPGRLQALAGCTPLSIRSRSTLSSLWMPTGGRSASKDEDGHGKLVRAGFVRQSQSGIFHLLPLGQRVQDKLEKLIDKHMKSIGASRLSLSTITTEELWQRSGRLETSASELFRLTDRRDAALMLSPTHEEEITTLVASSLKSYKDLPLRLYQISRKYRDEKRPRHGLLRSREFLMKDLYSFDTSTKSAIETYHAVSTAYAGIFSELKLPILVAEASSGDMGGDHSHEYHLAHPIGEDIVAQCSHCDYTANDEVATTRPLHKSEVTGTFTPEQVRVWRGVASDHQTLVNVWYPKVEGVEPETGPSLHAVRKVLPGLDTSIADPLKLWRKVLAIAKTGAEETAVINIVDSRLARSFENIRSQLPLLPDGEKVDVAQVVVTEDAEGKFLNLLPLKAGDACPKCDEGTLRVHKALELGHTFHLGTRYSEPLKAQVTLPSSPGKPVPVQMGCYGIGISRIIGAVAEHLVDERGLNWPRAIAPYEVAVIPSSGATDDVLEFFDALNGSPGIPGGLDAILDDRKESFGWKMRDADTIGYPILVVLGKEWKQQGMCEVQCRRLSVKDKVPVDQVQDVVRKLLDQL
ncbi:hypothetical protein NLU13_9214 [Sarocladium strictum]|uniref:proline--tRNA ligase n=1 Tax=Sarocladium strictum TaxID=5046 RepID=A0AA39GA28_SARSR|nr:hypothetical protein NLU13_9214 [Sarocladium strictum]